MSIIDMTVEIKHAVKTDKEKERIEILFSERFGYLPVRYYSYVFDLKEKALRDALIELGWTPQQTKTSVLNPQTMIDRADDFALQNDLTVEEAKISQAYISMLMERAKQDEKTNEKAVFDSLHCGFLA